MILQSVPLLMLILPLLLILLTFRRDITGNVTTATFFSFFAMAAWLYFSSEVNFFHEYKIFLTMILGMDGISYIFLLFTTFIYFLGWLFARYYFDGVNLKYYGIFYLLTCWGALGTIFSQDMISFYIFYSVMGLAIYPLLVFKGNDSARYAGKIYLITAITGEMLILTAIMIINAYTGAAVFSESLPFLPDFEHRLPVAVLLLCGFGIKTGLFPLHFILPVSYRHSPTPFTAVLGGALISIGVLGLIRFLPLGLPGFNELGIFMISLGIFSFIFAVTVAFFQREPKAVLGYSSISQMAIIIMAMGTALIKPESYEELIPGIVIYTFFHAIVKSALFFSVGVLEKTGSEKLRKKILLIALLPMAAIMGLPFTAGSFAKYALKHSIEGTGKLLEITLKVMGLAPVGSAFILFVLLYLLYHQKISENKPTSAKLIFVWSLSIAAAALIPLLFISETSVLYIKYAAWDLKNVLEAVYPFLLALGTAMLFMVIKRKFFPAFSFKIREGDIIVIFEALTRWAVNLYRWMETYERHTFLKRELPVITGKGIMKAAAGLERLLVQNIFWGLLLVALIIFMVLVI